MVSQSQDRQMGERRQKWPTRSERTERGCIRRLGAVLTSWRIIVENSAIRLFGFKSWLFPLLPGELGANWLGSLCPHSLIWKVGMDKYSAHILGFMWSVNACRIVRL